MKTIPIFLAADFETSAHIGEKNTRGTLMLWFSFAMNYKEQSGFACF